MIERLKVISKLVLLLAACSYGVNASAAQPVKSAYPTSPPIFKALIVETVYPFSIVRYTPPVPVQLTGTKAVGATPEQTVFQLFSAMQSADYEWNLSLWSPASRAEMRKREAASGQGKEYWERFWKGAQKKNYFLVSQISYGKYVIIEYEFELGAAAKKVRDTIALEEQGGVWYLTQALAEDPMLQHWDNPTGRVQVAPSTLLRK